ncbi:hypothetical protein BCR33DRAFT_722143 [Rhizoclosmatium globosum]|uniref:Bromodomain associated domain-containing protein n=1 Tax=Rhizoclosmatium globosum TaxID=329046 RepID=A0A1Y2BNK5_9FUNG|nr:hypothetical protein BCR33DRAFT_722143 [Rhizoclosmatium globosum]|eukprot:ORY36341.1 hypothetical protein BCR33DRAFT_722143 [Rhizoclosmatium globosum]
MQTFPPPPSNATTVTAAVAPSSSAALPTSTSTSTSNAISTATAPTAALASSSRAVGPGTHAVQLVGVCAAHAARSAGFEAVTPHAATLFGQAASDHLMMLAKATAGVRVLGSTASALDVLRALDAANVDVRDLRNWHVAQLKDAAKAAQNTLNLNEKLKDQQRQLALAAQPQTTELQTDLSFPRPKPALFPVQPILNDIETIQASHYHPPPTVASLESSHHSTTHQQQLLLSSAAAASSGKQQSILQQSSSSSASAVSTNTLLDGRDMMTIDDEEEEEDEEEDEEEEEDDEDDDDEDDLDRRRSQNEKKESTTLSKPKTNLHNSKDSTAENVNPYLATSQIPIATSNSQSHVEASSLSSKFRRKPTTSTPTSPKVPQIHMIPPPKLPTQNASTLLPQKRQTTHQEDLPTYLLKSFTHPMSTLPITHQQMTPHSTNAAYASDKHVFLDAVGESLFGSSTSTHRALEGVLGLRGALGVDGLGGVEVVRVEEGPTHPPGATKVLGVGVGGAGLKKKVSEKGSKPAAQQRTQTMLRESVSGAGGSGSTGNLLNGNSNKAAAGGGSGINGVGGLGGLVLPGSNTGGSASSSGGPLLSGMLNGSTNPSIASDAQSGFNKLKFKVKSTV